MVRRFYYSIGQSKTVQHGPGCFYYWTPFKFVYKTRPSNCSWKLLNLKVQLNVWKSNVAYASKNLRLSPSCFGGLVLWSLRRKCWQVKKVSQLTSNTSLSAWGIWKPIVMNEKVRIIKYLQQLESVMMFMTGVATKGHMNAWVQSHHLLPCWSLRIAETRTTSVTCAAPCGHDVVCLNCCHVSVYPTRVKVCVDVQDLGYHWRQGRCLGSGPATKKLALARTTELP